MTNEMTNEINNEKRDNNSNDLDMEKIIEECIRVIESTNLGNRARTSYESSLIEYARQSFISNIKKRFNLTQGNY